MAYELTGKIKLINDVQTFESGFTKREFVVTEEDDKYPQDILFECLKDKTKLLDEFKVGQTVTVRFDIRGREYSGRYFNNLQAWRISVAKEPAFDGDNENQPPIHEDVGENIARDDNPLPF